MILSKEKYMLIANQSNISKHFHALLMPLKTQMGRNCSECKKLLEMKKVARNTKSCQKVAEHTVDSLNIGHIHGWFILPSCPY